MDRISNLPDSVLSHILSLLPTKLAASTCVLSKRWQFLWTMIHNLDLECKIKTHRLQKYRLPTNRLQTNRLRRDWLQKDRACRTVKSIVNFVNKFFMTVRDKDLCIKRFRLKFVSSCSMHVDSWVLAAIASGVEELDLELCLPTLFQISCSTGDFFVFSCSIFTCKTLVTLKLNNIDVDAPQSSIHFPSLKVLHLLTVNFANGFSFSNLFYGCPVLEKLILIESETTDEIKDLEGYTISSPTLRELVINLHSARLWLEAPSLEYLNLDVIASTDIYLKNLGKLVEAVVYLNTNPVADLTIQDSEVEILHMVEHAFAALHSVQNLRLKRFTMQALFTAKALFENFPIFHNLVLLELEDLSCLWPKLDFCCFWPMLLSLLRKLPCLQHLTLYLKCYRDCDFLGSEAWAQLDVLNCFSHLRMLCFYNAFGWEDDSDRSRNNMGFLTYVLKNSTVLEKMTITSGRAALSSEQKRVISQKLASLERGSKKCQLKFEGEVL